MAKPRCNFDNLKQNIISDYLSGISIVSLSIKYKISKTTIMKKLKKENVYEDRKKKNFNGIKDIIIKEYLDGKSIKNLSVEFDVAPDTLKKFLQRENVYEDRLRFNFNGAENEIINSYISGESTITLGNKYGCSSFTISNLLNKFDIPRKTVSECHRKYDINENYFDNIDTPEKAYWLGLLYADGNNFVKTNTIGIGLIAEDKYILEKLAACIYKEYRPLYFRKVGELKDKNYNKTYICKDQYILKINNEHMSKVLSDHGMVNNKSLILTFPNWLNKQLYPHFIRGYFDGDGTLYFAKNRKNACKAAIVGTKSFCTSIQTILNELDISSGVYCTIKKSDLHMCQISSDFSCRKFLDWIYKDTDLFLDRKYQRYLMVLKSPPRIRPGHNICSICGGKYYARGYCEEHYKKLIKLPRDRKNYHKRYLQRKAAKLKLKEL